MMARSNGVVVAAVTASASSRAKARASNLGAVASTIINFRAEITPAKIEIL